MKIPKVSFNPVPKYSMRPSHGLAATLAISVASLSPLCAPSAKAADATWNVDADGSWVTDANWNPAAAPGSTSSTTNTDTATFGSIITVARAITVDTNRNISGINFSGNNFAYTLSGGNLLLTAGGTIQTSGAGTAHTDNVNSAISLQGDYTFTAGSTVNSTLLSIGGAVTSAATSGTTTLTLNGANTGVAGTNTAANVISGVISNGAGTNTVAISKSGAGKWILGGANTFSGGVTINAGTLDIQNNAALGTGTVTLAGGTLQASGAADRTITNNIVAQAGTTSTLSSNGRNLTINGNISGSGNINRGIPPTATGLILGGNNGSFTGTFTQAANNNAVVRFSNANAGGANASWVFQNGFAGRTTLDYAGSGTISFGSMTGGGHIQANTSGTKTISAGALGLNDTFSGILAANGASNLLAFTKVGTGTMTLSGNNTYTGGTRVQVGTLLISNASGLGTGIVSVEGGALNTTIANVNSGGLNISAGSLALNGISTGTYTLSGSNSFALSGGTVNLTLASASSFDSIKATPTVGSETFSITGGTLSLAGFSGFEGTGIVGNSYNILTGFDSGSVSGLTITGYDTLNWTADLSNSGVLSFTAVPEPSATLLMGVGVAVALFRGRRRSAA